jgi:hypothetical protein
MEAVPACLDGMHAALEGINAQIPDEIRTKSAPDAGELLVSFRADVLALVESRDCPDLVVDDMRSFGRGRWHAPIVSCERAR